MTKISGGANWGGRAQLSETLRALEDLRGNADGLHGNESAPAGQTASFFERQSLARKATAFAGAGLSTQDEIAALGEFVASVEAKSGPVMDADVKSRLNGGELFAAQKAIHCLRLQRSPSDVTDMLLPARGEVDGKKIDAGEVFAQHFPPTGKSDGTFVVVSPGFGMTGRDFYEQVQTLNERGHDVLVLDHQWAGQTSGKKGGIADGESIALATATVLAKAEQMRADKYGDDGRVMLMGVSMGGGPGGLGALLMADTGRLKLDDGEVPKGVDAVLDAPFLGATPSLLNKGLIGLSKVPVLNRVRAPWLGLPDITNDPVAEQKQAQGVVMEDIRAQTSAFGAADPFLSRMRELLDAGERPAGRLVFVQGERDNLADPQATTDVARQLGAQAQLQLVDSGDHVRSTDPHEQHLSPDAIERLLSLDR
jgi:alpha-beta hydrolase superfamily lysophospholipase